MRDSFDLYPTPAWATEVLLKYLPLSECEEVLEPCAGNRDIANTVSAAGMRVVTNDIREGHDHHGDATDSRHWADMGPTDWTITNPPFATQTEILKNALRFSRVGVAFLLRLTFLEPCKGRKELLADRPPAQLIVMPRISFTGDGKRDQVTTAWMIWHGLPVARPIIIEPMDREEAGLLL